MTRFLLAVSGLLDRFAAALADLLDGDDAGLIVTPVEGYDPPPLLPPPADPIGDM